MALDSEKVKKIAHLARLALKEEDISGYVHDLNKILVLVEKINAAETDAIQPLAHPMEVTQRLRADVVTEVNQRAHFQKNAPAIEAGLYLVPKVIE